MEDCHWFGVGFSSDVFILDIVLLVLPPAFHDSGKLSHNDNVEFSQESSFCNASNCGGISHKTTNYSFTIHDSVIELSKHIIYFIANGIVTQPRLVTLTGDTTRK